MSTTETIDIADEMEAALKRGISDEALAKAIKQIRDLATDLQEDLEYRVKDEMAYNLVGFVTDMAKRTVEAILAGNDDQMRRYLGCERGAWNGRSDGSVYGHKRDIDSWHPVIHGTLFEQGSIAIRRDMAKAHADLIQSERIKDLEDQVASLVAQNNKIKADLNRARGEA